MPVVEDAAQALGSTLGEPAPGRARHAGHVLVLPVQEPRRVRRRRRGHDPRRRRSPSACGCCASTARATSRRSSSSATTRAWTSCRRRSCASLLPHLDAWCDGRRAGRARVRGGRAGRAGRAARADAGRRRRRGICTSSATSARTSCWRRSRRRRSARAPTTACPRTCSRRCASPAASGRAAGHRGGRAHEPRDPDEPVLEPEQAAEVVAASARCSPLARLDRPHELAARARHAAGDRRRCARRGDEVLVTARDFAQTLGLLERFRIDHTAIGHHRGGHVAAKGARAGVALGRARALGARARDRPRARPRLQRRLGRRRAAADPVGDRVRLRVGDASSTRSTAGSRARIVVPDVIPPERLAPLRRDAGEAAAVRGPQGGVLPRGLRARPRRAATSSGSTATSRSRSCARRPPSRSTTASRRRCSPRCSSACAASRSSCSRARAEQRAELAREGGFIVPEQAIDAQSLIAFADLVISAGGTMNREAVALGTPVWTTFEGRLGAVDERADRRRPPAPARRAPRTSCSTRRDPATAPPSASAATPTSSPICS